MTDDYKLALGVAEQEYKAYARRWFILAIFMCVSMANASHWISMAIVGNVMTEYYDVSNTAIEWTSMVFMVTYVPFVLPAAMGLDKWVRQPLLEQHHAARLALKD